LAVSLVTGFEMAWQRILAQVLISAGGVVSKAFVQAYQQAVARTCVIVPSRVCRVVVTHGLFPVTDGSNERGAPLPRQRSFVNPPHTRIAATPFRHACSSHFLNSTNLPPTVSLSHDLSARIALALCGALPFLSLYSIAPLSRPLNLHALPTLSPCAR
jgi:hypothetical protein